MSAYAPAVEYVIVVGKIGGAVAGVFAAFAVLAKSPVGKAFRWVYRQVVGEPVGEYLRHQVRTVAVEVVDEKLLRRNGGTTIPDVSARVDQLTERVTVLAEQVEVIGAGANTRFDELRDAVDSNHTESVTQHAENKRRLDRFEAKLQEV